MWIMIKDHNRTLLTVCRSVLSPVSVSGIGTVDCCGFRSCKQSDDEANARVSSVHSTLRSRPSRTCTPLLL